MTALLLTLFIFLDILYWIIILDVVLSWLFLFGLRFKPRFISQIIDPSYRFIRSIIPTRVGPFELAPIIALVMVMFLKGVILSIDPTVQDTILQMTR